jgi:hypothetical protein
MLIPEAFKPRRRHKNMAESIKLIIANFVVISVGATFCLGHRHINWFFWIILGGLAVYNFFTLRKDLEVYTRADRIAYISHIFILLLLILLFYFLQ